MGRVAGRLLRVLRLMPQEILTTLRAVTVFIVVEILIRSVPLPRLGSMLGCRLDLAPARLGAEQLTPAELPPRAGRQLRCTRRVADIWPFSQGPCLRRALVGGHLLRDLGPAVRLGVVGSGDTLSAHAWLEIDGRPLENITRYTLLQQGRPEATG